MIQYQGVWREHFRDPATKPQWPYIEDRWKTAPVVVEYCNSPVDAATPEVNIRNKFVTLIGAEPIRGCSRPSEGFSCDPCWKWKYASL